MSGILVPTTLLSVLFYAPNPTQTIFGHSPPHFPNALIISKQLKWQQCDFFQTIRLYFILDFLITNFILNVYVKLQIYIINKIQSCTISKLQTRKICCCFCKIVSLTLETLKAKKAIAADIAAGFSFVHSKKMYKLNS